jgi:hypothetical protein
MNKTLCFLLGLFLVFLLARAGIPGQSTDDGFRDVSSHTESLSRYPTLLERFTRDHDDILRDWTGDPRTFSVLTLSSDLLLILPRVEPPSKAMEYLEWGEVRDYYYPFCNTYNNCRIMVYARPGEAWREVLSRQYSFNGVLPLDPPLVRTGARKTEEGFPFCFEIVGIADLEFSKEIPDLPDRANYVFRYCYDGNVYRDSSVRIEKEP